MKPLVDAQVTIVPPLREDDVDVVTTGERADLLAEALPLLRVLVVLVLPELVALGAAVDDQLGAHAVRELGLLG
jgi:hypothetical protein